MKDIRSVNRDCGFRISKHERLLKNQKLTRHVLLDVSSVTQLTNQSRNEILDGLTTGS